MHIKKYLILMPPMLIIGLILLYYLPVTERHIVFLVPIIFLLIYYAWIYIERRRNA